MHLPKVFLVCVLTTLSAALQHRFACYRSSGVRRFVCAFFKTSGRLNEKLYWLLESIGAMGKACKSDILISTGF
jgi:hypothetical protein